MEDQPASGFIPDEMRIHAQSAAMYVKITTLVDEYCHLLTTGISMDAATYNNVINGREELKQRIAAIIEEK